MSHSSNKPETKSNLSFNTSSKSHHPSMALMLWLLLSFKHYYKMLSTVFEHEVYLGFPKPEPLESRTYEQSFWGGRPVFLHPPSPSLLECTLCLKEKLTFLCQVFCPLDAAHAYNRVLYVLYCEKCERVFRCLKQQTRKEEPIHALDTQVRVVSEQSFELESSAIEVKELQRIIKKAKIEVEEQAIDEEEDEDDEEEGEELDLKAIEAMGFNPFTEEEQAQSQLSKEQLQSLKHAAETKEKEQQKDLVFEQYKKVMGELQGPVLLYSNIPIPYNSTPINPHHFCNHCHSKLSLELQLTERLLSLHQKLLRLDWGALMVYTCADSCGESKEECVVVQYEVDAVKEEEVAALRKRQKNKKRKEQKEKSKSRSKGKEIGTGNKEEKEKGKQKGKEESKKEEPAQEEEGDWD